MRRVENILAASRAEERADDGEPEGSSEALEAEALEIDSGVVGSRASGDESLVTGVVGCDENDDDETCGVEGVASDGSESACGMGVGAGVGAGVGGIGKPSGGVHCTAPVVLFQ